MSIRDNVAAGPNLWVCVIVRRRDETASMLLEGCEPVERGHDRPISRVGVCPVVSSRGCIARYRGAAPMSC